MLCCVGRSTADLATRQRRLQLLHTDCGHLVGTDDQIAQVLVPGERFEPGIGQVDAGDAQVLQILEAGEFLQPRHADTGAALRERVDVRVRRQFPDADVCHLLSRREMVSRVRSGRRQKVLEAEVGLAGIRDIQNGKLQPGKLRHSCVGNGGFLKAQLAKVLQLADLYAGITDGRAPRVRRFEPTHSCNRGGARSAEHTLPKPSDIQGGAGKALVERNISASRVDRLAWSFFAICILTRCRRL